LSIANFSLPFAGPPTSGENPWPIKSICLVLLLLRTIHSNTAASVIKITPPITPPMIGPLFTDFSFETDFAAAVLLGTDVDVVVGTGDNIVCSNLVRVSVAEVELDVEVDVGASVVAG
jgi:hypothetical protein